MRRGRATFGVRHGYLRHLAAVIEPQPEVSKMTIDAGLKPEGAAESAEVTNATWARIFDPLEPLHALVAERDDVLIGFSHYLFQRSTWLLNPQCYLQDLYVEEERRGGGVGREL